MHQFDHKSGRHVLVSGARIYYEEAGNPQGPPLVLLHGGLSTIAEFNGILPELAQRFRVIGIDSRGHGASTLGPGALTYERIQLDVEELLAHLGVTEPILLGSSDGGTVGYRVAAGTKIRVQKLITVGAHWHVHCTEPLRDLFLSVTAVGWAAKFPDGFRMYQRLNPAPDFKRLVESTVAMWLDATPSGYPAEQIAGISCPVLAIRGQDDHLASARDLDEVIVRVPRAELVTVPNAGHVAFQDQASAFLDHVRPFFDRAAS